MTPSSNDPSLFLESVFFSSGVVGAGGVGDGSASMGSGGSALVLFLLFRTLLRLMDQAGVIPRGSPIVVIGLRLSLLVFVTVVLSSPPSGAAFDLSSLFSSPSNDLRRVPRLPSSPLPLVAGHHPLVVSFLILLVCWFWMDGFGFCLFNFVEELRLWGLERGSTNRFRKNDYWSPLFFSTHSFFILFPPFCFTHLFYFFYFYFSVSILFPFSINTDRRLVNSVNREKKKINN
jgi:hypothetical protein